MPNELRLLGIHGLGDHRDSPWAQDWEEALRSSLQGFPDLVIRFIPFSYDDIFEEVEISALESVRAVAKLAGSGVGSLFGRRSRGMLGAAPNWLKWYAGYVVAWVEDEGFRTRVRDRLLQTLADEKPHAVLGHSLGSLISYDALAEVAAGADSPVKRHLPRMTYVTLGSQLGNPFVVGNLAGGRIEPLPVRQWSHLYNSEDDVFTAEISLPGADNFQQVTTFFDDDGWADHSAVQYLSHRAAQLQVWRPLAEETTGLGRGLALARGLAAPPVRKRARRPRVEKRKPRKRALLVGINDYPNPQDRLEGCVNDVFLISAVLQECDIPAEDIRIVLNERATAKGILDRLDWLLGDAGPGDQLIFYYSGHGAQLPTYGEEDAIDRMDETLVPHNFDWTAETCVTDNQLYRLYAQLPYDTRFIMMLDCCHSGGLDRAGGLKVRGLDPPDDIRHRGLRWKSGMWEARDLKPLNARFTKNANDMRLFCGKNRNVLRLGRAMMLRQLPVKEYESRKRRQKIVGPYLPVILQACLESQQAFEYRHGNQSYGAFTYSLTHILRDVKQITFRQLVQQTTDRLRKLRYDQQPVLLGPEVVVKARVPWHG